MNHRTAEAATIEQDPRWRAVRARDAAANGRFYVAVKSTGIYCLPSCPSTPAKPQNVRFYATGEEAQTAGFRACKRCKPDQWQPARPIEYAIGESTVGKVLAAQSDKGICALLLGDDPEALVAELRSRFPDKPLVESAALAPLMERVTGVVEMRAESVDVPLDLRGTPFQQQVWRVLREIPAGERISYSELARRVGSPNGMRAVAQACAANPVAVLVPCHRVVRSDGGLSGYRWGVERKRALLEREARQG